MAKPSSALSSAPVTTRRTRSQSAEPVEQARPSSRGGRAGQKAPSATAPVAGAKKRSRVRKEATELTTVEEGRDLEEGHTLEDEQRQEEQDGRLSIPPIAEAADEDDESRRVSVMSGTTAKTSFSQEEVQLMDRDIIVDSLSSLASAFDDLARVLLPAGKLTSPENWKAIRTPMTKPKKLYTNRQKLVDAHKEDFGTQQYIQPRIVLKALFGAEEGHSLPLAKWRPDDILLKINMIEMMKTLLIEMHEPGERTSDDVTLLERLLTSFPDTIAGSEYSDASVEIYAIIAAHVAIAKLEASVTTDPNFSAHHTIDTVFFDEQGTFIHTNGLGLNNTTPASRKRGLKTILDLADVLKAGIQHENGDGAARDIGRLKSTFRWDHLIDHALRYYEGRSSQVAERIASNGGIDAIVEELKEEVERREDARQAEEEAERLKQEYTKPGKTKRRSLGSMAKLRELERSIAEKQAPAPAPEEPPHPTTEEAPIEAPTAVAKEAEGHREIQAAAVPPPRAATQTSNVGSVASRYLGAMRKSQQARWIDPQPNATRVDPNMDDESQVARTERGVTPSTQLQPEMPGSSRAGKRRRVEEEDEDEVPDPTQDEGFQTDVRDFSAADQRRKEIQFSQSRRPQHREYPAPGPSNFASSSTPAPGPSPAKRQRTNPGSALPPSIAPPRPEDPSLPPSTRFERDKINAKLNRVDAPHRTVPRVRQAWSGEEENALIDLIEQYGGEGMSWSEMKKRDNDSEGVLHRRTAEDLRFKARTMKVTILRSGVGLPANWEYVQLGKKEIEQLARYGIGYQQQRMRAEPIRFDE